MVLKRYKSKEFLLSSYIFLIILICVYKIIEIVIVFNEQANTNLRYKIDSTELEWFYLAIFLVSSILIYELLLFAWSLLLNKSIEINNKQKISFYLILFASSIPIILLICLYYLKIG